MLRPWVRLALESSLALFGAWLVVAGVWTAGLVLVSCVIAVEVEARRRVAVVELTGTTVRTFTETGRPGRFRLDEVAAATTSRQAGGALTLRLTGGRRVRIAGGGALAPLWRAVLVRRPDLDDGLVARLERTERNEERLAARRDRHPWIRPLCLALFPVFLLAGLGWMVWGFWLDAELDRSGRPVTATVVEVRAREGRGATTAVVAYPDGEGDRQATVTTTGSVAVGDQLAIEFHPLDPTWAWAAEGHPGAIAPLWPMAVAAAVGVVWALLLPVAFAEHPVLGAIDPPARRPAR